MLNEWCSLLISKKPTEKKIWLEISREKELHKVVKCSSQKKKNPSALCSPQKGSGRHRSRHQHACWRPFRERPVRRDRPAEVAVRRVVTWRDAGQPHGGRRRARVGRTFCSWTKTKLFIAVCKSLQSLCGWKAGRISLRGCQFKPVKTDRKRCFGNWQNSFALGVIQIFIFQSAWV